MKKMKRKNKKNEINGNISMSFSLEVNQINKEGNETDKKDN